MATGPERKDSADQPALFPRPRVCEVAGLVVLALLAAHFLHLSWRKWPDPIVDTGAQWYDAWRVSQGAAPYHDFVWNYGPLSLLCNGLLFHCFGAGMMVLVTANLVVYGAIVLLAYLAFRLAWGWLAAFAALAVFISVFSFSILNGVGNYNYATPYTHEATHGILLMLVTAFVLVRWCRKESRPLAFLLGLCGGVAAVLKPEFMLAGGILAAAGCAGAPPARTTARRGGVGAAPGRSGAAHPGLRGLAGARGIVAGGAGGCLPGLVAGAGQPKEYGPDLPDAVHRL